MLYEVLSGHMQYHILAVLHTEICACMSQVLALNGQKIHSLRRLVNLVDSCKDKYLHFDLDYNQKVVLETKAARAATKSVLQVHCIPFDRSEDLRKGSKGRLGQSQ